MDCRVIRTKVLNHHVLDVFVIWQVGGLRFELLGLLTKLGNSRKMLLSELGVVISQVVSTILLSLMLIC